MKTQNSKKFFPVLKSHIMNLTKNTKPITCVLNSLVFKKHSFSNYFSMKHYIFNKPSILRSFSNNTKTSKVYSSSKEAINDIKSGSSIMIGGFGICGIPENLIKALSQREDIKDLHIISTNGGLKDFGIGMLMQTGQTKTLTASYVGENKLLENLYFKGLIELNLVPQGTLAEKIRAAGMGIPAFLTPTGIGTLVQEGQVPTLLNKSDPNGPPLKRSLPKNTQVFNGHQYVVEESISADFALIKAYKADTKGNLIFRKTARNFNQDMASAAKITIAEVEEIVDAGELKPDEIHCPGIFIQRIIKGEVFEKRLENIRVPGVKTRADDPIKRRIARRAAEECQKGMYINLGIGIPNLITDFIPKERDVKIHTENGMLGVGPYPEFGKEDPDLISALKEAVTETPGCSYFSSSDSFSMVRGHHVDLTFLGAMQVDQSGDISNWIIPGKMVKGMGGAMDLVASGGKVIVTMEHVTRNGEIKILHDDKLPYTGKHVISKLITDLAVFEYDERGMILSEIFSGVSLEEVKQKTEADYRISPNLRKIEY